MTFGAFAFTEPLLGVGDTRTPMYLMGALVLDLFLIFDWGAVPPAARKAGCGAKTVVRA